MKNKSGAVLVFVLVGVVFGVFATFVGHLNSPHPYIVKASK